MAYASHTSVPEEKTRAEIEKLVRAAGCEGYASGFDGAAAWVAFRHADRMIRFRLTTVGPGDVGGRGRTNARAAADQENRSRWRRLLLCIRAKFEAVESGIETLEEAFMPHIVMPDGAEFRTIGLAAIAHAYKTRTMPTSLLALPPKD